MQPTGRTGAESRLGGTLRWRGKELRLVWARAGSPQLMRGPLGGPKEPHEGRTH